MPRSPVRLGYDHLAELAGGAHDIVDVDRNAEPVTQILSEGNLLPSRIAASLDDARAGIDETTSADTDADDLAVGMLASVRFGVLGDRRQCFVRVVGSSEQARLDNAAIEGADGEACLPIVQVNTDGAIAALVQPKVDAGPAAG